MSTIVSMGGKALSDIDQISGTDIVLQVCTMSTIVSMGGKALSAIDRMIGTDIVL
ncbi:hypothetical protein F4604DRAFT_1924221 [Suillus subluteus]|nr:hypothetical protein F4604DRAFT_1924221 [Suillus subluteus]